LLLGGALVAAATFPVVGAADRLTEGLEARLERFEERIDLTFPRFPERSTIYARDGTPLARLFLDENRKVVHLRNVSHWARKAVLAIEDADFYEHRGVDYRAIGRATLKNLVAGEIEQGASTITQQLARNVIADVGQDDTLSRKIREAYVAIRLEQRYSKDEILELYLTTSTSGPGRTASAPRPGGTSASRPTT
jgi:membrane peptidoglycan carboxypeptidase